MVCYLVSDIKFVYRERLGFYAGFGFDSRFSFLIDVKPACRNIVVPDVCAVTDFLS